MSFGSQSDAPGTVILVVDDEPVVLRVVYSILGNRGYRVLAAGSAEQACEFFRKEPRIDLLFTDVVMPGTSGPELAQMLLRADPSLRVLFTAGMPDSPLIRNGVSGKGFELLPKPFLPSELVAKVEEVLATPLARAARLG